MGWDELDAIGTPAEKLPDPDAPNDQDLVDKLYVDALNTPQGRKLLAALKQQYLDQPVSVPGVGADMGFFREGQNSVVRDMIRRLIRGTTPKT